MKRNFLILLFMAGGTVILSACAPQVVSTLTPPVIPAIPGQPLVIDTPTSSAGCSTDFAEPTSAPSPVSPFPPVSQADFSIGPVDAPVTILEYCDFQSQGCLGQAIVVSEIMKDNDNVRFVFRPLPLIGIMDKSDKAVLAALAADQQGQFWSMYELLFSKYNDWANLKPDEFNAWVSKEAAAIGMNGTKLKAAMEAPETTTRMMSGYEAAKKLSIPAVPLVLINGTLQPPFVLDYKNLSDTIGLVMLKRKQFNSCPPFNIDPTRQYIATIKTEKGDITIQLFPDKAPLAVNSFVFLAKQGWYDGVTFHRVIPGFAAQAGDPSNTGKGNPGYFFNNETNDLKYDKPGMVGMANSGPNTNGSQFFITFAPAAHLNGGYTIFGQVISGLEVAEQLTPRDPDKDILQPPGDKIISVNIEEK